MSQTRILKVVAKQALKNELMATPIPDYPDVIATIISDYIQPEEYITMIISSEGKTYGEVIPEIITYLFKLIQTDPNINIYDILQAIITDQSTRNLITNLIKYRDNSDEARLVYASYLVGSPSSPSQDVNYEKAYVHLLIEKNDAKALDLLLKRRPQVLEGEKLRHLIPAFDGMSKITNVELAIHEGSPEALKAILQYDPSDCYWLAGGKGDIITKLDYAILHSGKNRSLECSQIMIVTNLKGLLRIMEEKKVDTTSDPKKTLKQYATELGHFFTTSGLKDAKTLATKHDKKAIVDLIESIFKLIELPFDQFVKALTQFEQQDFSAVTTVSSSVASTSASSSVASTSASSSVSFSAAYTRQNGSSSANNMLVEQKEEPKKDDNSKCRIM